MINEYGIDEEYETMLADIGGKPKLNEYGIDEQYENMILEIYENKKTNQVAHTFQQRLG